MNFQQLKYVREAVRNDFNLTEVANVLLTSQSGVSKQIKELEAELGVEIFVRKGKRLIGLTRAGGDVASQIERVLLETDNLRRYAAQFSKQDRGRLVIATTHNQARYTLPAVVSKFSERYPDVELELRQGTPKYVAGTVIRGVADIAVATEALDEYPELSVFPCFSWVHVAIVRTGHPLTKLARPTLADIAQYSVITYNSEFSGRSKIDAAFEREGLKPDIRLTAMDADVIKTYVELGLGVGIISEMAYAPNACSPIQKLEGSESLFDPSVTKVALLKGALLRTYAYHFVEMLAPHLTEQQLKGLDRRGRPTPARLVLAEGLPAFSAQETLRSAAQSF